jgi:hypothetical protein
MVGLRMPWKRTGEEKTAIDSPTEDVAHSKEQGGYVSPRSGEDLVDEDHDDLHREMKPRQLSMPSPFPRTAHDARA